LSTDVFLTVPLLATSPSPCPPNPSWIFRGFFLGRPPNRTGMPCCFLFSIRYLGPPPFSPCDFGCLVSVTVYTFRGDVRKGPTLGVQKGFFIAFPCFRPPFFPSVLFFPWAVLRLIKFSRGYIYTFTVGFLVHFFFPYFPIVFLPSRHQLDESFWVKSSGNLVKDNNRYTSLLYGRPLFSVFISLVSCQVLLPPLAILEYGSMPLVISFSSLSQARVFWVNNFFILFPSACLRSSSFSQKTPVAGLC